MDYLLNYGDRGFSGNPNSAGSDRTYSLEMCIRDRTISDLPEKADGKAIEYTWTEETLPEGYELTDNSKNGTVKMCIRDRY